jgi:hypothetical protein
LCICIFNRLRCFTPVSSSSIPVAVTMYSGIDNRHDCSYPAYHARCTIDWQGSRMRWIIMILR